MKQFLSLRSSQLSRFMSCSGYINLPQDRSTSEAAEEGTAWHWVIEQMLQGKPIALNSLAPNGVTVDEDMIHYASMVVKALEGVKVFNEYPIKYNPNANYNCEITGTCDSWWQKDDTLYVNDFKYGFALVDVVDNWQLMSYAFGVLLSHPSPDKFTKVVLSIMQPRPHHEDGWYRSIEISTNALYSYYIKLGERVAEYFTTGGTLSTGKHCKYCSGVAQTCTAFNKSFCASVDFTEQTVHVDTLTNDELDFYLRVADRAQEVLKIKRENIEQVIKNKLNLGEVVGNWRAVETYGHRKWSPTFKVEDVELLSGIDLRDSVVISPAQAERKGLDKEIVKLFTITESRGIKLENKDLNNKKLSEVFNK